MREIKFRAWDVERKKWTQNVVIEPNGLIMWCFASSLSPVENTEYIIQLSTGLKDKNGKEIYEGDILDGQSVRVKVFWGTDSWDCGGKNGHWSLRILAANFEVIGNIYENPELLKV